RHIRKLVAVNASDPSADPELLRRFAGERDEAAFAALVRRHGPLVLAVCRRVLHNEHDAEDAFQATFLILAKKAGSLHWHASIANWLYLVAYRVALRAKVEAVRRRARENSAANRPVADPLAEITLREAQAVLDEELARLPAKCRAPLLLCC